MTLSHTAAAHVRRIRECRRQVEPDPAEMAAAMVPRRPSRIGASGLSARDAAAARSKWWWPGPSRN